MDFNTLQGIASNKTLLRFILRLLRHTPEAAGLSNENSDEFHHMHPKLLVWPKHYCSVQIKNWGWYEAIPVSQIGLSSLWRRA